MEILSKGYKKPETGDLGDVFFPALEDNVQRVNDHTHDGLNSEKLSSSSVEAQTVAIVSGDFSLVGTSFEASVTCPSDVQVDTTQISFRNSTTKAPILLSIEKLTLNTFKVFANQAIDCEAVFG